MKTIGFIGVYDKIDLLLNIAKILTTMKKKVLIIDSTMHQKAKYVVPAINPTVSYITYFEDIDVAIGFNNMDQIKKYAGTTELPYDYLLVDADNEERINEFQLEVADKNYFVTSFDIYSMKKGIEIFNNVRVPFTLTKLLYAKEILKEDDDYLNYISLGHKMIWEDEKIYFPIENGDLAVIHENQRVQKIKFRRLSIEYKDALNMVTQQILNEKNDSNVRRAIKLIEKGV